MGELVAEIAGCFVCGELGIPNSDDLTNHLSYLSHWLRELENDPKAILKAASQASKAAKYILSFSHPSEQPIVEEAEHATG
jgi:antirestriction protein ArdC